MMMFATLDDLEGSIELIFFGDQLAEYEHIAQVDQIVTVRGRVGNDDRGLTIKVQACELFEPTEAEVEIARANAVEVAKGPEALTLRARRRRACPASIIEELKHVFGNHVGEADVVLDVRTSGGAAHAAAGLRLPRRPDAVAARRAGAHPRARGARRAGRRRARGSVGRVDGATA